MASYRIPKETEAAALAAPAPARTEAGGFVVASAGAGELTWMAPAAWKPKAGSAMRKASYAVGVDENAADLAITAFPGEVGGDLANVNRWRGQLSLPPLTEADLPAAFTALTAHGLALKVVDLSGGGQRMLGAIVPHAGATWFFKLTGPDVVVAKERAAYFEFLQTVKPADVAPVTMAPEPGPVADEPRLNWAVPAHWRSQPAVAPRKATYAVSGNGGAEGELAITAFPGDAGGELANVNRWRGQLALPPLGADELSAAISRTTVRTLPVAVVDLAGGPADRPVRLLGAIVPANGTTWFFKLTGPAGVVAAEKPAFLTFLETLSTP